MWLDQSHIVTYDTDIGPEHRSLLATKCLDGNLTRLREDISCDCYNPDESGKVSVCTCFGLLRSTRSIHVVFIRVHRLMKAAGSYASV